MFSRDTKSIDYIWYEYGMKLMDVCIERDTDRQMRVDLLYNYECPKVS